MIRQLTPEEQALWDKVKGSVCPLAEAPRRSRFHILPPAPPPLPGPRKSPAGGETLDSRWDQRIRSGKLQPDGIVDLHGMTRAEARETLHARIVAGWRRGDRVLLVITGKGGTGTPAPADLMPGLPASSGGNTGTRAGVRGGIRAELPRWLGEARVTSCIAAVRHAHPRHGGGGAIYLVLRRHPRI